MRRVARRGDGGWWGSGDVEEDLVRGLVRGVRVGAVSSVVAAGRFG